MLKIFGLVWMWMLGVNVIAGDHVAYEWMEIGVEMVEEEDLDDGIGEEELLDLQKWECSSANKFRKWNDFSCSYEPTKK